MRRRLVCCLLCLLLLLSALGLTGCGGAETTGAAPEKAASAQKEEAAEPTPEPTATPEPTPAPATQGGELDALFFDVPGLATMRALSYDFIEGNSLTVEIEATNSADVDLFFHAQIGGISGFMMDGPIEEVVLKVGETKPFTIRFDLTGKVELRFTEFAKVWYKENGLTQEQLDSVFKMSKKSEEEDTIFRTAMLERLKLDHASAICVSIDMYVGTFENNVYLGSMKTMLELPGYDAHEPPSLETQQTLLEDEDGKIDLVSFDAETGELWLLSENRQREETGSHVIYPIVNGIQVGQDETSMAQGGVCPYSLWCADLKGTLVPGSWGIDQLGIEEITSLSVLAGTTTGKEPVQVPIWEGAAPDYSAYPVVYKDSRIQMRYLGLSKEEDPELMLLVENLSKKEVLAVTRPYQRETPPAGYADSVVEMTVDGKTYNSVFISGSVHEFSPGNAEIIFVSGGQWDSSSDSFVESVDLTAAKTVSFKFELHQASYAEDIDKVFGRDFEVTIDPVN